MCKRAAVISDIHGNVPALEAALRRMDELGIEDVYCGGDPVGYGPRPNEICRTIEERRIATIYGNYDYAIARDDDDCGCFYPTPRDREIGQSSVVWRSFTPTSARSGSCASCPSTSASSSAGSASASFTGHRGR